MTLRGILTAQLPLQARWTCEARLARSFAASVLARIPLAATSDNVSSLTPFRAFFYLQVTADIRRHLSVSQELPGKTMVRLPKPLREKEFRMSFSKNAKSRIVTVTAPLFLGFVMPWFLRLIEAFGEKPNLSLIRQQCLPARLLKYSPQLRLSWCSLLCFFTLRSNQTLGSCFCLQVSSRLLPLLHSL